MVVINDISFLSAGFKEIETPWKDADPDIPILKQAKAEYAKLRWATNDQLCGSVSGCLVGSLLALGAHQGPRAPISRHPSDKSWLTFGRDGTGSCLGQELAWISTYHPAQARPKLASDGPVAMAFLDRIVEGAIILKIQGKSYRADRPKEDEDKGLPASWAPRDNLRPQFQLATTERNHTPGPLFAAKVDHFFAATERGIGYT